MVAELGCGMAPAAVQPRQLSPHGCAPGVWSYSPRKPSAKPKKCLLQTTWCTYVSQFERGWKLPPRKLKFKSCCAVSCLRCVLDWRLCIQFEPLIGICKNGLGATCVQKKSLKRKPFSRWLPGPLKKEDICKSLKTKNVSKIATNFIWPNIYAKNSRCTGDQPTVTLKYMYISIFFTLRECQISACAYAYIYLGQVKPFGAWEGLSSPKA